MARTAKNVTVIPAKPKQRDRQNNKKLRAAAYCRVSTDSDEQMNSYYNQLEYYEKKISENPDYEPVKVFADEGIAGVNTLKRERFNEMIEMCKAGKIDVILTKSIHRFARNTLDTVKYVRMLRSMNINVIFEQEGLQGINPNDEQIITIYASMAQNYSQTLSENVKWGFQRCFARGEVYFGGRMYGYRKYEDKDEISVVPEEAEIVKLIYKLYLDGYSTKRIAQHLEQKGILTAKGNKRWNHDVIDDMLSNEKYIGDGLSQKTFMSDVLTKKQVKNTGQLPQYYVTGNHEAIISKEIFKRVQFEKTRRKSLAPVTYNAKTNSGRYTPKYALTGILLCGECGHHYRRVTWHRPKGIQVVWRCTNRLENGGRFCRESPTLSEPVLQDTIMRFISSLSSPKEILAKNLKEHTLTVMEKETGDDKKKDIQEKLDRADRMMQEMLKADIVSEERIQALCEEYDRLKAELEQLGGLREAMEQENAYMRGIREYIDNANFEQTEYDDRLVKEVIEQIIVRSKDKLYIRVRGGYEAEVTMITDET